MTSMVTVIIPNFNHAKYLPRRIESVLQQTYPNLEIILMDDCSTDNSREIIAHYASKDSRIKVVLNDRNGGNTFKQWNKGITLATGAYIWIAESDDAAEPTLVETLMSYLEANPEVVLAYCDSYNMDEHDKVSGTWQWFMAQLDPELFTQDFVMDGHKLIQRFMSYRNIIPNASAVLLRRSTLLEAGEAAVSMKVCGDWLYWARILSRGKAAFVSRQLNYFRTHSNNVRSRNDLNGTSLLESVQILSAMRAYGPADATAYAKALRYLLDLWFYSFVYKKVPISRHRQIYRAFKDIEPSFPQQFRAELQHYLLSNGMSGLRMMLGDGFLFKITGKLKRNTQVS
ncbi:glycosyltransferase family A protein [Hymenobacter sp. BT770]|uniref:glycosyltransferase family 2 protein n=1 Tax=Hymenobacter sp. BT770 TaxID=2886942 RepID=UPI001D12C782|nr:glycosyltransferase family A protein [Hymenobacter sp. BT770]MCC3153807.1 glycosyltransferase family 2 protein [Hymenobacter sp. BT770]MDO3415951.1 glycosyltransferase family A protein [Hymenobacter sp. BT770]